MSDDRWWYMSLVILFIALGFALYKAAESGEDLDIDIPLSTPPPMSIPTPFLRGNKCTQIG